MKKTDSIIIGGGIIGMLSAIRLTQSGHKVTLLEKGDTGRESSWAGGGIVSPLYPWRYHEGISILARYGQNHYQSICEELSQETGIDPEYKQDGLLIFADDEISQAQRWADIFCSSMELVDSDAISRIEPAMRGVSGQAIWMPDIAQVRNPRIAKSLRVRAEQLGVHIITACPVESFSFDNQRVSQVNTPQGSFQADHYIVCSGAWSGMLLEETGISLPIHPVKGQMILFKAEPGDISRIVLEEDRYIIPRKDGRVLFGSTVEHSGFDKSTSKSALKELTKIARQRFPVLKDKNIEVHWAGLRPGTPEGIPVIGQHSQFNNLFVNAGHFRNGVVLAPGSCELLTRIVNGEPSELNHPAFSPACQAK